MYHMSGCVKQIDLYGTTRVTRLEHRNNHESLAWKELEKIRAQNGR
jgi:hypothetical protein